MKYNVNDVEQIAKATFEKRLEELAEEKRSLCVDRSDDIEKAEKKYPENVIIKVRGMESVHDWMLCKDREQMMLAKEISDIYDAYARKIAIIENEELDILDEMERG